MTRPLSRFLFQTKVDQFFHPEKRQKLLQTVLAQKNESLQAFESLDLVKTYHDLFEIMWYSQVK